MFKDFKEWRASYEATKKYGQTMGWLQTRDPVKQPMPPEQLREAKSRFANRVEKQRENTEESKRRMMGH